MSKPLVVVINGAAGVGKDTFVEFVREHLSAVGLTSGNISSVDRVKQAAKLLGWGGKKDERGRQFLSDLKDLATKAYDSPFNYMQLAVRSLDRDVLFFHIREPQEIERFLQANEGSLSVLIKREGLESFGNHADRLTDNFRYHCVVDNNGTLDDLMVEADKVVVYLQAAIPDGRP